MSEANLSPTRLSSLILEKASVRLKASVIKKIIEHKPVRINQSAWQKIVRIAGAAPAVKSSPSAYNPPRTIIGPRQPGVAIAPRRPLTREMVRALNEELVRTGASHAKLKRMFSQEIDGLTPALLSGLRHATLSTVRIDIWEGLMSALSAVPDRRPSQKKKEELSARAGRGRSSAYWRIGYEPIPPELVASIRAHRQRTGVSLPGLLERADEAPTDLNYSNVQAWLIGATTNAKPFHVQWVILEYEKHPDKQ